jgi:hypothetical protein
LIANQDATMNFSRLLAIAVPALPLLLAAAHASVTISNARTKHMSCAGGICTPTASDATLNAGDLATLLAASDVSVKSNAAAPDIAVVRAVSWASGHRLTLDAYRSIHVQAPVAVEGTSGLTVLTNDGGSGGDYDFGRSGAIRFWDTTSSLVINGASYTLAGDLKTLASLVQANSGGNYALANNYDASVDGAYSKAPIGAFSGTLEGLGNSISHLRIDSTQNGYGELGLISVLSGTVRDLGVTDIHFTSVTNGDWYNDVGAITAENAGAIVRCFATGRIMFRGQGNVGGLVGENGGGAITNSHASVDIDAPRRVATAGGLVGVIGHPSVINGSYASGSVRADQHDVAGGLAGFNDGTIVNSYATGAVSGGAGSQIGGLVANSYDGTIQTSYATGAVTAAAGRHTVVGGLVGDNAQTRIAQSVWDTTTTGVTSCTGQTDVAVDCTGLTDAQLKAELPAGFDPTVWAQSPGINNGYPYLIADPPK